MSTLHARLADIIFQYIKKRCVIIAAYVITPALRYAPATECFRIC